MLGQACSSRSFHAFRHFDLTRRVRKSITSSIAGPAVATVHLKPTRPSAPVDVIVRQVSWFDNEYAEIRLALAGARAVYQVHLKQARLRVS